MEIDFEGPTLGQQKKSQGLNLLGSGPTSQSDLEKINQEHEKLISDILVQEEQLISQHR